MRTRCQEAIALSVQLIELNDSLFLLPSALVVDVRRNAICLTVKDDANDENTAPFDSASKNRKHIQPQLSPLQTSIRFASLTTVVASPQPTALTNHATDILSTDKKPVRETLLRILFNR